MATRAGLFLVGWLATYLLAGGDGAQPGNLHYLGEAPRLVKAWVHFDAEWYLLIADRGYGALAEAPELAPRNVPADTSGFFPLFPVAVRALSFALPGRSATPLAALLLANGCLFGFLLLLHGHTAARFGAEAARGAVVAACFFPTSLFLSAPYSESLYLLLALGALEADRRDRPGAAGLLAAGAALTRPVGLFVALPLLESAWRRRASAPGRAARWLAVCGAPAGLASYAAFCAARFGDPLAFVARQARWRGEMGAPWTFAVEFLQHPAAHGPRGSVVDLTVALAALALLPTLYRRLGAGQALYAAATLLLPLSTGLFSFSRLVLAAFPLFTLSGVIGAGKPAVRLAYAAIALPFAGFFAALYCAGWWVG